MDCLSLRDPLFLAGQAITGLATGGVYALIALGLVLIYKSSEVINFAQGDLLLFGAYIGWALTTAGVPFLLAFVLAIAIAAATGVLTERLILRRMVGRPVIAVIIVTLGLSSMLRGLVFLAAGTDIRRFPEDVFGALQLTIGELTVPGVYV